MSYSRTHPAPSHQRATKPPATVPTVRGAGRPPVVYTPEVAAVICERIASGETLSAICKSDGMPSAVSFRRWALARKDLFEALQAARQLKADALFDEALDMGRELAKEPGTSQRVRAYDVAMSQLRWSAGKLDPQRFSDRSQMSFVVPIQIVTSLDLGQAGVMKGDEGNIYEIKATVVEPGDEPVADEGKQAGKQVRGARGRGGKIREMGR